MTDLPPNVTIVLVAVGFFLTAFGMYLAYMYYQTIRQDK